MKRILLLLGVLLLIATASYAGYRAGHGRGYEQAATTVPPASTEPNPLSPPSKAEPILPEPAGEIIKKCRAEGTYKLHDGEVGLLMKGGTFQPVKNTTEEALRALQNPECPFTKTAIE